MNVQQKWLHVIATGFAAGLIMAVVTGCEEMDSISHSQNNQLISKHTLQPEYRDVMAGDDVEAGEVSLTQTIEFHGSIQNIEPWMLTVEIANESQRDFTVTAETRITLDGSPVELQDLSVGQPVEIVAEEQEDLLIARQIVATRSTETGESGIAEDTTSDLNALPATSRFDGEIVTLSAGDLTIVDPTGIENTFLFADNIRITLDGEEATLANLSEGFFVSVNATVGTGHMFADTIDARSK